MGHDQFLFRQNGIQHFQCECFPSDRDLAVRILFDDQGRDLIFARLAVFGDVHRDPDGTPLIGRDPEIFTVAVIENIREEPRLFAQHVIVKEVGGVFDGCRFHTAEKNIFLQRRFHINRDLSAPVFRKLVSKLETEAFSAQDGGTFEFRMGRHIFIVEDLGK